LVDYWQLGCYIANKINVIYKSLKGIYIY